MTVHPSVRAPGGFLLPISSRCAGATLLRRAARSAFMPAPRIVPREMLDWCPKDARLVASPAPVTTTTIEAEFLCRP